MLLDLYFIELRTTKMIPFPLLLIQAVAPNSSCLRRLKLRLSSRLNSGVTFSTNDELERDFKSHPRFYRNTFALLRGKLGGILKEGGLKGT